VVRLGGRHEGLCGDGQQVVLAHQPRHSFVVDRHAAPLEFSGDPAISVTAAVLEGDLLDGRTELHLFLLRVAFGEKTIEPGPADPRQPAHRLHSKAALHGHHFPDLLVDAVSPEPVLDWRRASTFCKAPLKKSTSSVFSPSDCFSRATCSRN
jgi:hypothetical protein